VSLRKKLVILYALIFLLLAGLLHTLAWVFILGGYQDLERREVSTNVNRATQAVRNDISILSLTVRDWAFWDDTYAFVNDPYPEYIQSNLTDKTLAGLGVQLIVYLNARGETVFAKAVDLETGRETSPPAGLSRHLDGDSPLLLPISTGEGVSGLLVLAEGVLMVSSQPILTSNGEGPANGALVMGRLLSQERLSEITTLFRLDIESSLLGSSDEASGWPEAERALLGGADIFLQAQGSSIVRGYALLEDVYDRPALMLRVNMDRATYRRGLQTVTYFILFLTFSSLVFFLFTVFMVEKTFLRRLTRLKKEVLHVGAAMDHSLRVPVEGKDEISDLAASVNNMLEHLAVEERRFRSLIEHAMDMVLVVDTNGTITYQSPSTQRVLGYEPGDFLGKDVFSFIHPQDRERMRYVFSRSITVPDSLGRHHVRVRKRDGSWCRMEVVGYNLVHDAAVGGMVINARDVTEELEARERLERLNSIFTQLGADIMENIDRIVFTSRDLLGVPYASYTRAVEGKLVVFSTAPGEEGFLVFSRTQGCFIRELIEKGTKSPVILEDAAFEYHCGRCPHSVLKAFRFSASFPVACKQETIGFLSIFDRDRRALSPEDTEILATLANALAVEEERLAHEQDLKDFIDIASHELRHPVTVMKGYAITLRDYGDRMDERARRELLDVINQAADRLDLLIRELLDISRIERGRLGLNRTEADLRQVVERALKEMEAKGYRGRFMVSLSKGLSRRRIDQEKILRVLVILLDNAVTFSPDSSLVEIEVDEADGNALISVLDRGPGVPEGERERIFDRFYQVEDVLHHSKSGMGMGLYIARQIVEYHGGRIWHEPRPGGGSIFRFTLP